MKIDYHLHTYHSKHASGTPFEYCKKACEMGYEEIGISDHIIPKLFNKNSKFTMNPSEFSVYFREIEEAKNMFPVKTGLEIDFERGKEIEKFLSEWNGYLDYVLGSCHFINGYFIPKEKDIKALASKYGIRELYNKYFKRFIEAVETGLFDIMAHPDVIRRYTNRCLEVFSEEKYMDKIDEAVDALKRSGTCIEINSRGYFHPVEDSFPSKIFLRKCIENGIPITIGSDAHSPEEIGYGMDRCIQKFKKEGGKEIALFNKRKRKLIKI